MPSVLLSVCVIIYGSLCAYLCYVLGKQAQRRLTLTKIDEMIKDMGRRKETLSLEYQQGAIDTIMIIERETRIS